MTRRNAPSDVFPERLSQLHLLDFDFADGEGIDFEPFDSFLSEDESNDWFKAWTGNPGAEGSALRVFGQDGTGGHAAIWLHRPDRPLLDQPIVFLGSEGAVGVVATVFDDYLWILTSGHGPLEAIEYPDDARPENEAFAAFARTHARTPRRALFEIAAEASEVNREFTDWVQAQCR